MIRDLGGDAGGDYGHWFTPGHSESRRARWQRVSDAQARAAACGALEPPALRPVLGRTSPGAFPGEVLGARHRGRSSVRTDFKCCYVIRTFFTGGTSERGIVTLFQGRQKIGSHKVGTLPICTVLDCPCLVLVSFLGHFLEWKFSCS